MSPPSAVFDAYTITEDAAQTLAEKKVALIGAGKHAVNGNQTKLLDTFAGKWDSFKFAPIRESQVSRAMTKRYFQDLDTCKTTFLLLYITHVHDYTDEKSQTPNLM